jgi:hypothetical protein
MVHKATDIFHSQYKLEAIVKNEIPFRRFRYGLFKYSVVIGLIGAYLTTDYDHLRDDLKTRPEFLPSRILTGDIPLKERKVFENLQGSYFGRKFDEEEPVSFFTRARKFLYPWLDYNPGISKYIPSYDMNTEYVPREFENHYHFKNL